MDVSRHFATDLDAYLALPDGMDLEQAKKVMQAYMANSAVLNRAVELGWAKVGYTVSNRLSKQRRRA